MGEPDPSNAELAEEWGWFLETALPRGAAAPFFCAKVRSALSTLRADTPDELALAAALSRLIGELDRAMTRYGEAKLA